MILLVLRLWKLNLIIRTRCTAIIIMLNQRLLISLISPLKPFNFADTNYRAPMIGRKSRFAPQKPQFPKTIFIFWGKGEGRSVNGFFLASKSHYSITQSDSASTMSLCIDAVILLYKVRGLASALILSRMEKSPLSAHNKQPL